MALQQVSGAVVGPRGTVAVREWESVRNDRDTRGELVVVEVDWPAQRMLTGGCLHKLTETIVGLGPVILLASVLHIDHESCPFACSRQTSHKHKVEATRE